MPNIIGTMRQLQTTGDINAVFCFFNNMRSLLTHIFRCLFLLALFAIALQFDVPITFAQDAVDEIVVGVPSNFPPHYLINEKTGEPDGFGIEVIEHIAGRSGLKIKYNVYDTWGDAHRAMKTGRVDVIPNMGITPERHIDFDFTKPVETLQIRIFVRSATEDIENADDLTGRKVAVVETNKGRFLMEERGGVELQIYSSIEKALLALLSGKADALVFPDTVINWLVRESGLESNIKTVGEPLFEVNRGIAVRKGLPELLERLDAEVDAYVLSPEYKEIYARWHSAPEPYWSVRRVTILMGSCLAVMLVLMLAWRYISIIRINKALKAAMEDSDIAKAELEQVILAHQKDKNILKLRTEELGLKIDEVNNVNKAFVGRELKMVELKKEIEELKKKL